MPKARSTPRKTQRCGALMSILTHHRQPIRCQSPAAVATRLAVPTSGWTSGTARSADGRALPSSTSSQHQHHRAAVAAIGVMAVVAVMRRVMRQPVPLPCAPSRRRPLQQIRWDSHQSAVAVSGTLQPPTTAIPASGMSWLRHQSASSATATSTPTGLLPATRVCIRGRCSLRLILIRRAILSLTQVSHSMAMNRPIVAPE